MSYLTRYDSGYNLGRIGELGTMETWVTEIQESLYRADLPKVGTPRYCRAWMAGVLRNWRSVGKKPLAVGSGTCWLITRVPGDYGPNEYVVLHG